MDFSEAFKMSQEGGSGQSAAYSPCGKMIATVDQMRVTIRDAETLEVVTVCECCDIVLHIEWTFDSRFLMCVQLLRARVWVFPVGREGTDLVPAPAVKIDEGVCGLSWARLAPDGRHLLTWSQFNIRLTIWSILDESHYYIESPKFADKGVDFDISGDVLGNFMAVAHRKNFKDSIKLYSCRTWDIVSSFDVPTLDLTDIKFSPNGRSLCVWDSPLQYTLLVYSVPKGEVLLNYCAYEDALAIKNVAWSPNSMFLAVGSYDKLVRIVNSITWKVICEYGHVSSAAAFSGSSCTVYCETLLEEADMSQYILGQPPIQLPEVAVDPDKPNPKMGVGRMKWSADSDYLATRNDNQPNCVYVWLTRTLSLVCVLKQLSPVRAFNWNATKNQLVIITETNRLFTWTPSGAACITIPSRDFHALSCVMNPHRDSLLVMDRTQAIACYAPEEDRTDD